jgi:hypothetical protein
MVADIKNKAEKNHGVGRVSPEFLGARTSSSALSAKRELALDDEKLHAFRLRTGTSAFPA